MLPEQHRNAGEIRPRDRRCSRHLPGLYRTRPRSEECPHVKRRLRGAVGRITPCRACVPGEASSAETPCTGGMLDMRNTSIDVVAARGERTDGTGGKAWALDATLARTAALVTRGKVETFAKCDCAPVSVPQAVVRVHQRSDGRGVYGGGPLCPPDERQPGRAAERKVRGPVQGMRKARDDPPAPSVQGVRRTVVRFLRSREDGPHPGSGVADEEERPRAGAVAEAWDRVVRDRVKRATAREPLGFDGGDDGIEMPYRRRAAGSGFFHAVVPVVSGLCVTMWMGAASGNGASSGRRRSTRIIIFPGAAPSPPCRQASRYS